MWKSPVNTYDGGEGIDHVKMYILQFTALSHVQCLWYVLACTVVDCVFIIYTARATLSESFLKANIM